MQLSFLGQSYTVSAPPIEVMETGETLQHLGQTYTSKQYKVEQPELPPEELRFMGQRYVLAPSSQSLPCQPRPGEQMINGRRQLQLSRSRLGGRRHPAFRSL